MDLLFYCVIKGAVIWNIPYRLDVQLLHFCYAHISFVITTTNIVKWMKWYLPCIILEEVNPFFAASSSYIFKEFTIFVFFESIINLLYCYYFVAGTDSCCDGLARLVSCPILDSYVLTLLGPSLHLESSARENAFIAKDEMAFWVKDFFYLHI